MRLTENDAGGVGGGSARRAYHPLRSFLAARGPVPATASAGRSATQTNDTLEVIR